MDNFLKMNYDNIDKIKSFHNKLCLQHKNTNLSLDIYKKCVYSYNHTTYCKIQILESTCLLSDKFFLKKFKRSK